MQPTEPSVPALAAALSALVEAALRPRLRAVVNRTGTVIHTNLGRTLLADAALQQVLAHMRSLNDLEYELASGGRGRAGAPRPRAWHPLGHRSLPRPVIGCIADDRLLLDLRCLEDVEPFTTQWPALPAALS